MDTELILGFENSKVEQGTFPQMMLVKTAVARSQSQGFPVPVRLEQYCQCCLTPELSHT